MPLCLYLRPEQHGGNVFSIGAQQPTQPRGGGRHFVQHIGEDDRKCLEFCPSCYLRYFWQIFCVCGASPSCYVTVLHSVLLLLLLLLIAYLFLTTACKNRNNLFCEARTADTMLLAFSFLVTAYDIIRSLVNFDSLIFTVLLQYLV